jgi:hypothetical protein
MTNPERAGVRPWWVKFAARRGTKRHNALVQVNVLCLVAVIGFLLAAVESGSTSLLGRVGLPLDLLVGGLSATAAVWSWLAIRWVDRHGGWA